MQRRLLPLLPPEFGDYMLTAQRGFEATADVAVVGPALKVLDADLAFEVGGPSVLGRVEVGRGAVYRARAMLMHFAGGACGPGA